MNLDNLTNAELMNVWEAACKKLGFYNFLTVSVKDIKHEFQEMIDNGDSVVMPSEESIHQALSYVRRKHNADEWLFVIEWVMEVSQKLETDKQQVKA